MKERSSFASYLSLNKVKGWLINMMTAENTYISDTLGEYLEVIYELSHENDSVRTTDIANRLGLSKPSVNRAVGALKLHGYVTHNPYGDVELTEKGRELGEYNGRKQRMIKKFLITVLSIPDDEAAKEACVIGRGVSRGTVERMKLYMEM